MRIGEVLTMAEYIDRGALMRRIKEIHCAECDSYHGVRCRACWVDDTLDYIDSEPAADVAPVRHGRWIWHSEERGYLCSECGSGCLLNYESDWHKSDWCPHCGADMRGINDE